MKKYSLINFFCCFLLGMNNGYTVDYTVIRFNNQDSIDLSRKLESLNHKKGILKRKIIKTSEDDPLLSGSLHGELFREVLFFEVQYELCYKENILLKIECNNFLKKKPKEWSSFSNLRSRIITLECNCEELCEKILLLEQLYHRFLEDEGKIPVPKNRRAFLRRCIYCGASFVLNNVVLYGVSAVFDNYLAQFEPTSDVSINTFLRGAMSYSPVLLGNYFMCRHFFSKGEKKKNNNNEEINKKKRGKAIGSFFVWCIYQGVRFSAGNIGLYRLRNFLIDNKCFPQFDITKDSSVLMNVSYFCMGNFLLYKLS